MWKSVLLLSLVFLVGCASYFKRKECEAKNWYAYGQELAMKGIRPSGDDFVQECRKAEAEFSESQLDVGFKSGMEQYCKPETALLKGKSGENINLDFCASSMTRILTQKHQEGVKIFCLPENAFSFGGSGKVYNGICPEPMEKAFKKEYLRGRKKYLEQSIVSNQQLVNDLSYQISNKSVELSNTSARMAYLRPPQNVQKLVGNSVVTETVDPDQWQRSSLQSDINRIQQEIRTLQAQQEKARTQIQQHRQELGTME